MNIFYKLILILIIGTSTRAEIKKHVIGCSVGAGLFYNFLGVINNLLWCKQNSLTPIVYWGSHTLYYDNNGYQGKTNVWEYYFEPVSDYHYIAGDGVWNFNKSPDGREIRPIEVARCSEYEKQELRIAAGAMVNQYIKVRPYIQKKIDTFLQANMVGRKTIGIHLRGTDKRNEVKPIKIKALTDLANEIGLKYPDCQFLVATDEEAILQKTITLLNQKVIYYDAFRSQDGVPVHWDKRQNRPKLGEDVVVEAYYCPIVTSSYIHAQAFQQQFFI